MSSILITHCFSSIELVLIYSFHLPPHREGHSGGPEAVELGELKLQEQTEHTSPSLQTVGALLRDACVQLPSIRGCFLTHLAHLEPSVLTSRDALLGRSPWVKSHLLPELTGPTLPSDWPFLPLVSLYDQTGVSDSGGLEVEALPQGALQSVTHCLQWLLVLEVWREEALKVQRQVQSVCLRNIRHFTDCDIWEYLSSFRWSLLSPSSPACPVCSCVPVTCFLRGLSRN